MSYPSINQRIDEIRDDTQQINRFVEEYKPFIASCAEKVAGRFLNYGSDDELSIAMLAFVEAINSFNQSKGSFFSFSRNVIKRRIIDYYRKEKRHDIVVSLNMYIDEKGEDFDLSTNEAIRQHSEKELSQIRGLEMKSLAKELESWNITFSDLTRISPKHKSTRDKCMQIVGFILFKSDILNQIVTKRYLPVAELEKETQLPRKLVERFRKYIIALVIIETGDYGYIQNYIKL